MEWHEDSEEEPLEETPEPSVEVKVKDSAEEQPVDSSDLAADSDFDGEDYEQFKKFSDKVQSKYGFSL